MSTEDARKLFVAGLSDTMSEDVLRQLFEAVGTVVVDVSIPRDRATGKPRGFGFVTMGSEQDAEAARQALDNTVHAGRSVSVRPFQAEPPKRTEPLRPAPSIPPPTDRTLYVGNLPFDCSEETLAAFCRELDLDGVQRINLVLGPDGRRRGFGFLTMASSDAATIAMAKLQASEMNGRKLIVNVAHGKNERPARSERFESPRSTAASRSVAGPSSAGVDTRGYEYVPMREDDAPRRVHDERKRPRVDVDRARAVGRPKPKERRRSGRRRGGYADDYDDDE